MSNDRQAALPASVFTANRDSARTNWDAIDVLLILSFVAVKTILLILGKPVHFPDSGTYLNMARGFVGGAAWLHHVGWTGLPPPVVMRTAGYPLFLAALREIAGPGSYLTLSIWLQSAGTVILFLMGYSLQRNLVGSRTASFLFTAAAVFSVFLLYDLTLLSDPLAAVTAGIALLAVTGWIAGVWRPGSWSVLGIGILWGWSIITRPANLYFTFLPVAGVVAALYSEGASWRKIVLLCVMFLAPVTAITGAHAAWNRNRAGFIGLSTVGFYNWLWPLFTMDRGGLAAPFGGTDEIDRAVAAASGGRRNYPAIMATLHYLAEHSHKDWRSLNAEMQKKWIATAERHPLAYAVTVLDTLKPLNLASVLFNPYKNIRDLANLGPWRNSVHLRGYRALRKAAWQHPSARSLSAALVVTLMFLYAQIMFLIFTVAIPVWFVLSRFRAERRNRRRAAMLFCWAAFYTVILACALVHLEDRMIMPVVFPALIAAFAAASDILRRTLRIRIPG